MQIDPNSYTLTPTSRGGGSRGGKTGAERMKDSRKNRTPQEQEKDKQKQEGEVGVGNLTSTPAVLKQKVEIVGIYQL